MAKPRVLLFPFPALGHVKPFLTLAELLSDAGLDVVFLNTEYNQRRTANVDALAKRFPSLRFETIPDGMPPDQSRSPVDGPLYFTMSDGTTKSRFRRVIQSFNDVDGSSADPRPITCIINDVVLSSPIEVAEEFGIPVITFCPYSARYLSAHFFIPRLLEEAQIPYTDGNPAGEIHGLPLFEGLLRRNHLPGVWNAQSPHISFSHILINQSLAATRTSALILNTFDDLEPPFLTHLSSVFDKIYTIGPLHALSKSILHDFSSSPSTLSQFWKQDDRACLSWLDSQPPGSVLFVSFGSIIKMEACELAELWHGLVNSDKRFLCVLRSDVVYGGASESAETIQRMVGERRGKGIVVEWAAQEEVLAHSAVGGFLTHAGWNSTQESIVAGVPMIGWPIHGDQAMNATWIDKVWKIGIERPEEKWDRSTVETMIGALMDGEKGVEIQRSMDKLSKLANEKVVKRGLSFRNLELLVEDIIKLKKKFECN